MSSIAGTRWLADCGVGGSTPTWLMELDRHGDEQDLLGETRRITPIEGRLFPTFMHQVRHGDMFVSVGVHHVSAVASGCQDLSRVNRCLLTQGYHCSCAGIS